MARRARRKKNSSPADEIDYFDRVSSLQPGRIVASAWDDAPVDLDCDPVAAHLEPFQQREQAGVAFNRVLLAVELNRKRCQKLRHRKSRFPVLGQAALGGTAIVPPSGKGGARLPYAGITRIRFEGFIFSVRPRCAHTPSHFLHITSMPECQKTGAIGMIGVRSKFVTGGNSQWSRMADRRR